MGEKSSAPAAGPSNTSPPWSGSGTGEHRRRRGGGASEASQETTVGSPRSSGPRPPGTSCHSPTPLPLRRGEILCPSGRAVQHLSPVERQRNGGGPPEAGRGRVRSEPGNRRGFPAVPRTAPPRHFVPLPHSANRFVGEKSSAPAAGPSNTSPPWSGSGTGEYRRRRGGGASEASQEPHRGFPAVLRTAPPRHFVPLPHSANRFVGEKSSTAAAVPSPGLRTGD